ncbi:hypothetical protein V8C42DRAFT_317906 [Trichoderma barbatum]
MRYTTIFTIISLGFSGAMAAESFGPPFDLDINFDFPNNPCEWVGASCDPIGLGFCSGLKDATVNLPCGPGGIVGVGCCWHEGSQKVWFDQWREWFDRRTI